MKSNILLVEDEYAICLTLKEYLILNYDVITAQSATQALKDIEEASFVAAIVDLNLPDMHGSEVVKAIRKKSSKVAILALTGDKTPDMAKEIIAFGGDDYLVKPITKATLLKRLNKAIVKRLSHSQ